MDHLGSAHDEAELEALKAAVYQRLAAGQGELDRGLDVAGSAGAPLPIVASRTGHRWDALCRAYQTLGLDTATGGDAVFRDLVPARIIEPTSKLNALRVLAEVGVDPPAYRTLRRRLPLYAWQNRWKACSPGTSKWLAPRTPVDSSREPADHDLAQTYHMRRVTRTAAG
jgi:hypothetical protein